MTIFWNLQATINLIKLKTNYIVCFIVTIIHLYKVVMCVLIPSVSVVGVSRGSQKRSFKNASKPYHAVGNGKKDFWCKLLENKLRNKENLECLFWFLDGDCYFMYSKQRDKINCACLGKQRGKIYLPYIVKMFHFECGKNYY